MELPKSSNLPIEILAQSFNNTTNSYKFYWFLSILDELSEKNSSVLSLDDLALQMISLVWYPLDYFKLSFGKQDSFKTVSNFISEKIIIDNSPKSQSFHLQIKNKLSQEDFNIIKLQVNNLIKYVPYRFLRPFFSEKLRGKEDTIINNKIFEFANNDFLKLKPYYRFLNKSIEIHSEWAEYFIKNKFILQGFILWHLLKFLQKNNPNVVGLSEKLFKPTERNLSVAQRFWKIYIDIKQSITCIYSNEKIIDNFSIDHFVPWSYLVHDQLWNLVPTTKIINSSKSDCLPNVDKYFHNFTELQFDAFKTIYKSEIKEKNKLLEDYSLFFNSDLKNISEFSKSEFKHKLENYFIPTIQIAMNMGFSSNWNFRKEPV